MNFESLVVHISISSGIILSGQSNIEAIGTKWCSIASWTCTGGFMNRCWQLALWLAASASSSINPVKDIWFIIFDILCISGMIYIMVYREELTDKSRLRRFDKFKVIWKLMGLLQWTLTFQHYYCWVESIENKRKTGHTRHMDVKVHWSTLITI